MLDNIIKIRVSDKLQKRMDERVRYFHKNDVEMTRSNLIRIAVEHYLGILEKNAHDTIYDDLYE